MIQDAFWGILIPFLGTSLGAGCVFFLKKSLSDGIQRALTGFAAGVMVAASVWSLLIPAMEQAADLGRLAFFPAAVGFWLGILFLLLLDHLIPHLHQNSLQAEGPKSQLQRTTMMVLAVTLHNIPEGMAVGVVYACLLYTSLPCKNGTPERPQMLRRIEMIDLPAKRRLLYKYCAAASFFIAIFKNSANQNGIFAICSLRMLLVH